ncbi:pentapeptide repeat-containing protein [Amycolatopsis sp. NPDC003861]
MDYSEPTKPEADATGDELDRYDDRRREAHVRDTAIRILRLHRDPSHTDGHWLPGEIDLTETSLPRVNFAEMDLAAAQLGGVNFASATLEGTDFSHTNLRAANLENATACGATFRQACLAEANLTEAVLIEADFRGADLSRVNLIRADLRDADLRGADLTGAKLLTAKLTGAQIYSETQFGIPEHDAPPGYGLHDGRLTEVTTEAANSEVTAD